MRYEPPERICFTDIEVLRFLWGLPWDDLSLNFVHALRPSYVRVVRFHGAVTLDAVGQRVTVGLEKDGLTIRRITQEVEAGAVGAENGHDLTMQLARRKGET